MSALINRVGERYGKLKVVRRGVGPGTVWVCLCDCGQETFIRAGNLKTGNSKGCGKCKCANNKLAPGTSASNALFGRYQSSAKKRNISWDLSKERFLELTKLACYYCGQPPSQTVKNGGYGEHPGQADLYLYTGVDRVDPKLGYTQENCVPSCKTCNFAKQNMNGPTFEAWIMKVFTHLFTDSHV